MRLINADDAIKKLKEYVTEMESDIYYGSNLGIPEECICEAIEEVHTIEAEPVKHGKWEKVKCNTILDKAVFSHALKCSKCGKWKFENVLITQKFYYCPNCGAKMDGGEENGLDRRR
ncbi:MAG: hypothetical protein K2F73_03420 [Ruminococcus sp.]|nr:hypothetical protein [Ruminococcus sp.]